MKLNKFFMLGMVGLAFAACSNEEEVASFPDGGGAVSIRLVNPGVLTKGIANPTPGSSVAVTGTIKIDLYDNQTTTVSQTMSFDASTINDETVLTFWNVQAPKKIAVSINNGAANYSDVAISDLQAAPASIPAYGETTKFTLTDDMKSPDLDNDHEATGGNKQEQGANEGDDKKLYQIYTAKVTMAIPVARLEVSGIKHKEHPQQIEPGTDQCEYTTLTIKGVYMDNLYTKGGAYQENNSSEGSDGFYNSKFADGSTLQDYCWDDTVEEPNDINLGTGITAILKDAITTGTSLGENFLEKGASWPKSTDEDAAQVFAYNFYPASGIDNMPKFKIYFDTSVSSDPANPKPAPRFAMITKYKKDGRDLNAFEPGKIYRITNAELVDGNIIGDESGNTLYGVEVTVKEAEWSVVDITADWAGSN